MNLFDSAVSADIQTCMDPTVQFGVIHNWDMVSLEHPLVLNQQQQDIKCYKVTATCHWHPTPLNCFISPETCDVTIHNLNMYLAPTDLWQLPRERWTCKGKEASYCVLIGRSQIIQTGEFD